MTQDEYLKIKEEADRLNRLVYEYEHKVVDLASSTQKRPIHMLTIKDRYIDNLDNVELTYKYCAGDVPWECFSKIAKFLHQSPFTYYMSTTHSGSNIPYVRECEHSAHTPKRYSDMTEEQIKISGRMVEELIEVWNRYFQEVNTKAYLLHGVRDRTEITVK